MTTTHRFPKRREKRTHFFELITYINDNSENFENNTSGKEECYDSLQECFVQSKYSHTIIAIDEGDNSNFMSCYEIVRKKPGNPRTGRVRRIKKELKKYKRDGIRVGITKKQFGHLRQILNQHVGSNKEEGTPFNELGYCWNFCPLTSSCPCKGKGVFCSQFVAEVLEDAGIITLDGYVMTDGYLPCKLTDMLCNPCAFFV